MERFFENFPTTSIVLFAVLVGFCVALGKGLAVNLIAAQQSVQWTAFAAGGLALFVGFGIGFIVARGIYRRR